MLICYPTRDLYLPADHLGIALITISLLGIALHMLNTYMHELPLCMFHQNIATLLENCDRAALRMQEHTCPHLGKRFRLNPLGIIIFHYLR
jgi:hypothetical protein